MRVSSHFRPVFDYLRNFHTVLIYFPVGIVNGIVNGIVKDRRSSGLFLLPWTRSGETCPPDDLDMIQWGRGHPGGSRIGQPPDDLEDLPDMSAGQLPAG